MNSSKMIIGKRLKKCRKDNQYTQEKMSELLNVSVKHYSEVERGISGMSIDNWIRTAELLNTSLDYLLRGINSDEQFNILSLFQDMDKKQRNILYGIIYLVKKYHDL